MTFKVCLQCGIEKSISEFHKQKHGKFGVRSICKKCRQRLSKDTLKNRELLKIGLKQCSFCKQIKHLLNFDFRKDTKTYRGECKECRKNKKRLYFQKNKKVYRRYLDYLKHYRLNNKEKIKILSHNYNKKNRVYDVLKGRTKNLLGCSIKFLKKHLESQFKLGMSWDNYGLYGWHVDHIRPCASFDLSKPEEQRKCFHYTNLQPLWAEENNRKRAKCHF